MSANTKVAIIAVGDGGVSIANAPHYVRVIELFTRVLRMEEGIEGGRIDVRVFEDVDEAKEWLDNKGSAVFITWGAIHEADRIAAECPDTVRVVLWTGGAEETTHGRVVIALKPAQKVQDIVRTILG